MIPYSTQTISDEDIHAVIEVLNSSNLTQGPAIKKFERAVLDSCGAEYACAVNSATSALHISCLALGLGPGDWLWTSPITFVASANCALYCGAKVDFVDIDPATYNMCPIRLEQKLVQAAIEKRLPKIVVPVHLCGQPCDMRAIHALGQRFGFKIIEDASHAIGGRYLGQQVGSCRYSDITVFSFHPVKIITTGEGGMAITNCCELAVRLGLLRSHGITRDPLLMTNSCEGPWYYEQVALGYNFRMTDIQAALGCSQMKKLRTFVSRRHELAARYDELLRNLPITVPWQHPDGFSARHLYVIRLQLGRTRKSYREIFEFLRLKEILVNLHYIPVHMQPYYKTMGFSLGDFPEAERYYSEAISIPLYPTMSEAQQDEVIVALEAAL
jgi:UDP-4-amino-4,6-dideoxy-N-acetyl-beta-L-altrosamine transaminase